MNSGWSQWSVRRHWNEQSWISTTLYRWVAESLHIAVDPNTSSLKVGLGNLSQRCILEIFPFLNQFFFNFTSVYLPLHSISFLFLSSPFLHTFLNVCIFFLLHLCLLHVNIIILVTVFLLLMKNKHLRNNHCTVAKQKAILPINTTLV